MRTHVINLNGFFELSSDLYCIVDFEGNFIYVNPAWERVLGYSKFDLNNQPFMNFVHRDDHPKTRDAFENQIETGDGVIDFENRYIDCEGRVHWLHWHATVLIDEKLVYGVARDVTKQKNAEIGLDQAHAQLGAITESLVSAVMLIDENKRITRVNPAFMKMFGYEPEEIVGQSTDILYEDDYSFEDQILESYNLEAAQRFDPYEIQYQHKSGYVFFAETIGTPIIDPDGNIIGYFSILQDITRRKVYDAKREEAREEAVEAQRVSESLLESTVNSMDDWVMALDTDGYIQYLHLPWNQNYDIDLNEAIGEYPAHVFPFINNGGRFAKLMERVKEGQVVQQVATDFVVGGRKYWMSAKVSPRYNQQGEFEGITVVARDVSKIKNDQERIKRYAEELEEQNAELDAFAHTVAHDLKNPISSLISTVDLINTIIEYPDEDLKVCLELLDRVGTNMHNIVSELLLLAQVRKADVQLHEVNIHATVVDAIGRLEYVIRENSVQLTYPSIWPNAQGYSAWIVEVWSNYISNAIKYGGTPPMVELGYTYKSDGWIRYWVQDNGQGLTDEEQDKLFVPFTQLQGLRVNGHGLGLSIVQRILDKCSGRVGVESQFGKGSRFWFELPAITSI